MNCSCRSHDDTLPNISQAWVQGPQPRRGCCHAKYRQVSQDWEEVSRKSVESRYEEAGKQQPDVSLPLLPPKICAFFLINRVHTSILFEAPAEALRHNMVLLVMLGGRVIPHQARLTMQHADQHGSAEAAWELELLPDDDLAPQRDSEHDTEVAQPQGPDDQLPSAEVDGALLLGLQEVLHGGQHADKATAERHDGHRPGNSLDQDVLDGGEGEGQMPGEGLEYAEAHERGRHSHHANPTSLEAKVHVRKANDEPDQEASSDGAQGEAAALDVEPRLGHPEG